ncbi:hypothetical protein BH23ACT6_BH23ACT6_02010 [soil metagenome]
MDVSRTATLSRWRAGLLGIALTAAFSALAVALLVWAGSGVIGAGLEPVPVADALSWCAALVAGCVALALAWCALSGGAHLLLPVGQRPCGPHIAIAPTSVAPRVAAILLALTLGSPAAAAEVGVGPAAPSGAVHAISSTPALAILAPSGQPDSGSTAAETTADDCGADSEVDADDDLNAPRAALDPPTGGSSRPLTTPGPPATETVLWPDWRPARSELPVPGSSTSVEPSTRPNSRATLEPDSSEVVVLRGDSLWSISAEELGPDASDAQIAARWPQWYEANRLTIGPDPDVILPGHILTHPDCTHACPTTGERP